MTSAMLDKALGPLTGMRLFACVAELGSESHPYHRSHDLLKGPHSSRNLADAVHFLCTVHGCLPGVVDRAVERTADREAKAWLAAAADVFSDERTYLARLVMEAGPIPGTPGAASAEAALLSQRHALEMLSGSERNGCALGAAMALVADWSKIRFVMNAAAMRFGVPVPPWRLGDAEALRTLADNVGASPLVERALLFGAQQIMLQHHGLWDLLEARHLARMAR